MGRDTEREAVLKALAERLSPITESDLMQLNTETLVTVFRDAREASVKQELLARLVVAVLEYRGMTFEQIGELLGIKRATAQRWARQANPKGQRERGSKQ